MAFRSGLTRLVNGRLEVTKASHTFSTPRMSTMLLYPRPCHLQTHWRSFSISAPQLSRLSKRHGRQGQYQRVNESDTICSISAEEEDTLQKFEARRRSARFWLSLGIVVFAVLPGISVWRDQHLEDAARGNGGRGSSFVQSIMRRFQFNDLTGVDPAVDRAILTSVMKHEQAAFLGPAFKALRKLTGAKPGEPPGFVEKNFLDLADWYVQRTAQYWPLNSCVLTVFCIFCGTGTSICHRTSRRLSQSSRSTLLSLPPGTSLSSLAVSAS